MVIDCFTFYNELELLEIRLRHLWDHVEKFILVEADHTHQGKPKPFIFQEHEADFAWASSKMTSIQYRFPDPTLPEWGLENEQRNAIWLGLRDCHPDHIAMIGDLDEFPSYHGIKRAIAFLYGEPENGPVTLLQWNHYYFVNNLIVEDPCGWCGTVMCLDPSSVIPQELRDNRTYNRCVKPGGHHFSYLSSPDNILTKVKSIADEEARNLQISREEVERRIREGLSLYEDNSRFKPYDPEIDQDFPPYLLKNRERYAHLFIPVDSTPGSSPDPSTSPAS